jgi:hypothetical protein
VLSALGEERVQRLVTSPEMKTTWQYFAHAKVEASAIEALPKNLRLDHWGISEEGSSLNELACAAFLACFMLGLIASNEAVAPKSAKGEPPKKEELPKKPFTVVSGKDVDERTKPLLAAAEQCRKVATLVILPEDEAAILYAAAKVLSRTAEEIEQNAAKLPYTVPERARGPAEQRAQAQAISRGTTAIFGSPQYGAIATALKVALELRISQETVRAWCKGAGT